MRARSTGRLSSGPVALLLAGLTLLAVTTATASASGEPSPGPVSPGRASCAERYPGDGPAGLDLQLGCIAAEIVASYTGAGASTDPPRISSWLLPMGLLLGGAIVVVIGLRLVGRRIGKRLAPTLPAAWWSCLRCRSLNPAGSGRCYACGQPWTRDATAIQPAMVDLPGEPPPS